MLEYVFFVYTDTETTYVGNFASCAAIDHYIEHCYKLPDSQWSTACIHQDYLYLPKDFVPIYPEDCTSK